MSVRTIDNHSVFSPPEIVPAKPLPPTPGVKRLPTLGEVLFLPLDEVRRLNVGFVNLLCATGLPDTTDLDVHACIHTLEEWTRLVGRETERCLHQFRRSPSDYNHSEAYFRALMMVTVLQQDCGVRYNANAINRKTFDSSCEGFLHGLLTGDKTGTCANMPVLYAAVGRRLGYPIYTVGAKGHFFNRWHDAATGERFNIEASGLGMNSFPDAHYLTWPHPITDDENFHGIYLRNYDAVEELGCFMATRGHCLKDKRHLLDAIVAYTHAHRLAPTEPHFMGFLLEALNDELDLQKQNKLPTTYRQAEDWGQVAAYPRFVLNSRYTGRVAGVNVDENTDKGRLAR